MPELTPAPSGSLRTAAARTLRALAIIAVVTLALTWALRLVIEYPMRLPLWDGYWQRDFAGNLAFTLVVWALVRRTVPTLAFAGLVITALQLINATKLLVLGVPGAPEDFANVVNLYRLAEGAGKLAVAALIVAPFALLAIIVRWRAPATWVAIGAIAGAVALVHGNSAPIGAALDARFGNSAWNQPGNWRQRGLALHLLQETVRDASAHDAMPTSADVRTALAGLPPARADLAGLQRRNVHMIVLESFFDVASLGPEWVPEDPFPPELRALWAEGGHSVALTPTFGGYTANAEFEALCGFPVIEQKVFFEGGLRREAPCLPRVLARGGYRTVASHPNVPQFWNRTLAYRLAGFQRFLSVDSFDTSDSIGDFLLDHSLYEQLRSQAPGPAAGDAPTFNYVLTYHGHVPYPSSPAYPDRVTVGGDVEKLHGYANQLWYKSRDLVAEIRRLRADDPDALIVAFGDHLPFLDFGFGVYDRALGLPPEREDFTAGQLEFLTSTPLLVVDGRRGPVNVGKVPLYRLPSLILDLLGTTDDGAFAWTANPPARAYRPVYGLHYETPAGADAVPVDLESARADATGAVVCLPGAGPGTGPGAAPDPRPEADPSACAEGDAWLARLRALIEDLFTGRQHSLDATPTPYADPAALPGVPAAPLASPG